MYSFISASISLFDFIRPWNLKDLAKKWPKSSGEDDPSLSGKAVQWLSSVWSSMGTTALRCASWIEQQLTRVVLDFRCEVFTSLHQGVH